jgi:hypothetical protein
MAPCRRRRHSSLLELSSAVTWGEGEPASPRGSTTAAVLYHPDRRSPRGPPARRAQTTLLCLPARTGLTPGSAHPHALASHQRPPAPPARTTRFAARPGIPPRSATRRAPPGHPPSSAYPPATLHRPTHRRHPRSAAAVRSPGRCPPAARTPPAAVWEWGILGNDSKWPSSTSVRGSCYN